MNKHPSTRQSAPRYAALRPATSLALLSLAWTASAASPNSPPAAKPPPTNAPSFRCGGINPKGVVLWPMTQTSNPEFTNQGADCSMWQNFIYLNWPAAPGKRGIPDYTATFGNSGTTVWETYPTSDQVFLPGGAKPQPWASPSLGAAVPQKIRSDIASGKVRLLTRTSKVSHTVSQLRAKLAASNTPGIPLDVITQADGNTLYDQNKNPVYYEVLMNRTQFDYIVSNGLYNANTQAAYAARTNIVLPPGSMELKAAWKILTPTELKSGRFHTAKGYIPSQGNPGATVDIGLVGLHVFVSEGAQNAGLWATFYQIDNAPLAGTPGTGPYSFNSPGSSTPANSPTTNPTQVVQMFPDDTAAVAENAAAKNLFLQGNPSSTWQYYAMVATQWSQAVLNLNQPIPAPIPLSPGNPNQILPSQTLVNPVLETFMQSSGTSCMGCHSSASTQNGKAASGFSFMFSNAQAPSKP